MSELNEFWKTLFELRLSPRKMTKASRIMSQLEYNMPDQETYRGAVRYLTDRCRQMKF